MAEDELMMEEDAISLEDATDSELQDTGISNLVDYVKSQYKRAEDYRDQDEDRWIRAYRNYRGLYGPDVQFTEQER